MGSKQILGNQGVQVPWSLPGLYCSFALFFTHTPGHQLPAQPAGRGGVGWGRGGSWEKAGKKQKPASWLQLPRSSPEPRLGSRQPSQSPGHAGTCWKSEPAGRRRWAVNSKGGQSCRKGRQGDRWKIQGIQDIRKDHRVTFRFFLLLFRELARQSLFSPVK